MPFTLVTGSPQPTECSGNQNRSLVSPHVWLSRGLVLLAIWLAHVYVRRKSSNLAASLSLSRCLGGSAVSATLLHCIIELYHRTFAGRVA